MIQFVVEKNALFLKINPDELINYHYFCFKYSFDFYEVAYQCTSQYHFNRVATPLPPTIYVAEHNNFPIFIS